MLRLDINLLFTIINVLIIFWIIKKFLFKPIHKILDARQAEIDKQYKDAEAVQNAADSLKKEYETAQKNIAQESRGVLEEAKEKAYEEYDRILADAKEEASKIVNDARNSAKLESEKYMQNAKEQVTELVLEATAKIMASKQDSASDKELYDQFIAKTGEQSVR